MNKILLSSIVIGDRQRKDLGRIDELAESISETGLIQPIVLDEGNVLLAGRRRLEACKRLGWTEIPFVTLADLSPTQKQIVEYEEDMRRKDRTWQEKCLACGKLFKLKEAEANGAGESWSVRKMADFTGIGKSSVQYMVQIGEEIAKDPTGQVAMSPDYTTAIKVVLARNEKEANAEIERRMKEYVGTENKLAVTPTKPTVEKVAEENVVKIYGANTEYATTFPVRLAICYQWRDHQSVAASLLPDGAAFFWLGNRDFNNAKASIASTGLFVMPHPLVWSIIAPLSEGHWPFTPSYTLGFFACKVMPDFKPSKQWPSVISGPLNGDNLPDSVVEFCLQSTSKQDDFVLMPGNGNPVAVARMGRVPVWFEPDPVVYEAKLTALKEHYESTIPNCRFECVQ